LISILGEAIVENMYQIMEVGDVFAPECILQSEICGGRSQRSGGRSTSFPIKNPVTGELMPPNTAPFNVNGEKSAFVYGAVRVVHPFKVIIRPSSPQHEAVINRECEEVLPILQHYD